MDILNKLKKKIKLLSPVQIIVYSFVLIIAVGTFFLYLPISVRSGQTCFLDSFFTSVSCTCVTGLSLHDTWSHFTLFGQIVILSLIQIGGLGLVSFTTGFTLIVHRKLGLRDMKILKEGIQGNVVDIPNIVRTVFISTFVVEVLGVLLLSSKFVPKYGLLGLWLSLFLAVSSYCNAGFDITGFISQDSSLMIFNNDPFIMFVVASLIIIGGFGFLVIIDIYSNATNRFNPVKHHSKLSLQTNIVLKATFWLLLVGTLLFFCFEYENTLKGLSIVEKLSACFMQSASSRTAGLFSFNLTKQYNITKLITIIFMFIGASPTSTGGGIKTVSFVVLISTMWNTLCGRDETVIYNRKINKSIVYRSLSISLAFIIFISIGTLMISILEAQKPILVIDILYEVVSAISTTGLSTGITRSISDFSKYILIFFMFVGRVGPISLILAITTKKDNKYKMIPEGKLIIS